MTPPTPTHHDTEYSEDVYECLLKIASGAPDHHETPPLFNYDRERPKELRKMKKFRFQLLHRWLEEHFEPCRAADIAGGKGLLAYLLQQSGWRTAVIDPTNQALPDKYKDIQSGKRIIIPAADRVQHIDQPFIKEMGDRFDLLIGMHAHGCNAAIIQAAAEYGCGFVIFPCCVIDEPFYPPLGVEWLESLASYAVEFGLAIHPFRLNFKGQNIGLYHLGRWVKIKSPSAALHTAASPRR